MASWGTNQNKKRKVPQPNQSAGDKKGVGQPVRAQSLLSAKMAASKPVSRAAAYKTAHPGSTSYPDGAAAGGGANAPTVTVQPATTPSNPANTPIVTSAGDVVGTTNSGSGTQSSDPQTQVKHVLAQRIAKPPKATQHDEHPFTHGSPPTDGWTGNTVPNPVVANSRKKLAKGFQRSNRLRRSFQ